MTRISLPAPTSPAPALTEKWEKARSHLNDRGLTPCGKWKARPERRKHDRTPCNPVAIEVTIPNP